MKYPLTFFISLIQLIKIKKKFYAVQDKINAFEKKKKSCKQVSFSLLVHGCIHVYMHDVYAKRKDNRILEYSQNGDKRKVKKKKL